MDRRNFVNGIWMAAIGMTAATARAQRVMPPIARPPRPSRPLAPGRLRGEDGFSGGALPGIFVLVSIDARTGVLVLRDESGATATVYANEDVFDLDSFRAGEEVEVDFFVPEPNSTRLEVSGIWKR